MNTTTHQPWVEIVRRKVAHMQYGSVQVIVHEGRVTQVEATEKTRLPNELSSDRHEPEANFHGSSHRNSGAGA